METITEAIDALASSFPDRVAFVDLGLRRRELTYAQAHARVRGLAGALRRRTKPGDKVLLYLPNSSAYALVLFACAYAGLVAVPSDLASGPQLAHRIAKTTRCSLKLSSVERPLDGSVLVESLEERDIGPHPAGPDDVYAIVATSGTTSEPKGVVLTHRNVVSNVRSFMEVLDASDRRYLSILPLSHMLEQTVGLLIPLRFGSAIVYPGSLRPQALERAIRSERISTIVGVPLVAESLHDSLARVPGFALRRLGLRELITGGAPMPEGLIAAWERKGIHVYVGYGLTETAPIVACSRARALPGSVGAVLPGVQVRIVHGEIEVRGPNVMRGYFENETATREAFDGRWFRTGDLGRLEGDELFVTGRKKNVIITANGMNVYPEDLESVLESFDGVDEACVVQVGERIVAAFLGSADPDRLRREANAKLRVHERLDRAVRLTGDFPRTSSMKIKRAQLASDLESGTARSNDPLIALVSTFASGPVEESSSLADLGIDSLARMQLASRLEERFRTRLDETRITPELTIAELREVVREDPPRLGSYPKPAWIVRALQRPIRWYARLRGVRIRVPRIEVESPVLFVSNHTSHLDTLAIVSAVRTPLAIAAAQDFFYRDHRVLGFVATWTLGAFPFVREGNPLESFERAGRIMDAGSSVLVYPEGTRNARLGAFERGIGLLARELRCTVVPLWVSGARGSLPKGSSRLVPGTVRVDMGEPLRIEPDADIDDATARIREAVRSARPRREPRPSRRS